jgi:hypothetical protein
VLSSDGPAYDTVQVEIGIRRSAQGCTIRVAWMKRAGGFRCRGADNRSPCLLELLCFRCGIQMLLDLVLHLPAEFEGIGDVAERLVGASRAAHGDAAITHYASE